MAELPDDAPGDDRTDTALRARAEAFEHADALDWLMQGAQGADGTPFDRSRVGIAADPESGFHAVSVAPEAQPEPAGGSFMRDVITGVGEIPRQAAGGIRDAAQSILDLTEFMASKVGIQADVTLPDFGEPQTMAGAATRTITQFLPPH